MRFALAGIFQLIFVAISFAAVTGRVETIGFGSIVRPDCWVPMNVRIESDSATAQEFELQVVQYDLNGDEVVYTRPVVVNPGRQTRWIYFKPESINGGMPAQGSATSFDLAKRIRVFLADPESKKRLVQVSVRQTPSALGHGSYEVVRVGNHRIMAGQRLVVVIGRSPNFNEYSVEKGLTLGLMESVIPVPISDPGALPDSVVGYEMVDTVVWTDTSPELLSPAQFRAIRQFVQGGGELVVLQNAEAARMEMLNDLLPVMLGGIEEWNSADPLRSILQPPGTARPIDATTERRINAFDDVSGPFRMARAQPMPTTLVESWVTWPDGSRSPYIARKLYGNGTVAWVAQDLSDPSLQRAAYGWPRVWELVFGWRHYEMRLTTTAQDTQDRDRMFLEVTSAGARDMGAAFLTELNLDSKTAALLSLAFVFFLGYWALAGPVSFLALAAKARTHWSWFVYGGIAIVAVVLTVGVTQLVLQGSAEIRHVSLVRATSDTNTPAHVLSRFGVYLPEDRTDDPALVALAERDENAVSTITPLTIDPRYSKDSVSLRDTRYEVPFVGEDAETVIGIGIPFRSTLKKLQADWTGPLSGRIAGKPVVRDDQTIAGTLSNNTGRDLRHVLMVFRAPAATAQLEDRFIYKRIWPNGQTIDLAEQWRTADAKLATFSSGYGGAPLTGDLRRGYWRDAQAWLYEELRGSVILDSAWDDSASDYTRSFPIVSLFSRLTPMRNANVQEINRADILRRGVRNWDVSNALAAGALVVLAQSSGDAIPLPLQVDEEPPEGFGRTFWQLIVPIDRSHLNTAAATQPADGEADDVKE